MATDENVVQFPKGGKGHDHKENDPDAKLYVVRAKIPEGEYRMGVMACSMSCVFSTIMHAIPEHTMISCVVIVCVGKPGDGGIAEWISSLELNT